MSSAKPRLRRDGSVLEFSPNCVRERAHYKNYKNSMARFISNCDEYNPPPESCAMGLGSHSRLRRGFWNYAKNEAPEHSESSVFEQQSIWWYTCSVKSKTARG